MRGLLIGLGAIRNPWRFDQIRAQLRMKKYMNVIGDGVGEKFLHSIRRVATTADFFRVCEAFLTHDEARTLELAVSETNLDLPAAV